MLDALFGSDGADPDPVRPDTEPGSSARPPASPVGPGALRLTAFQEEARRRVDAILARYRGAVLADSVGLGKTYVALRLAEGEIAAGRRVVVIAPASLTAQWNALLRRLGAGWSLCTHAAMSRGRGPGPGSAPALVVVDEAHRFRNPETRRYGALARLTWSEPSPRVLLVTATPVNNHPRDLLHLLRLFLPDHGLLDAGVPSLEGAFDRAGPDGAAVRAIVHAVVVRRTRSLLADRFGPASAAAEGMSAPRFPQRAPLRLARYRDPPLTTLVEAIGELELAPYEYTRPPAGTPAGGSALLRLALLKRLDSSPAAFLASVHRLRHTLATVQDAALAGRVLRPASAGHGIGDGDPLQLVMLDVLADAAAPGVDLVALAESTARDVHRLDRMRGLRGNVDPKGDTLVALLAPIAPEKVVVFTEYRDTAAALWHGCRRRFPTGRVDGGGAWLGERPAGRRVVIDRFAPVASGRPAPPDRERVDVLIATDVLAEGLNLQDARHVISYDLPWNPVRLMQRIGRVDRLGSRHTVVVPHLFVPAHGIDAILGLRRRLLAKLDGIAATGGEEDAGPLLAALAPGGTMTDDDPRGEAVDPVETLRTLWIRTRGPPIPDRPSGRPSPERGPREPGSLEQTRPARPARRMVPWADAAAEKAGNGSADAAWLVVVRDRARTRMLEVGADQAVREVSGRTAATLGDILDCGAPDSPTGTFTEPGAPSAPPAWLVPRVRSFLIQQAAERVPAPAMPRSDPARELARKLRLALADTGLSAGSARIRRAGTLLERLARPLDPAAMDRAKTALAGLRLDDGRPRAQTPGRAGGADARQTDPIRTLDALLERIQKVLGGPAYPVGNAPARGRAARDEAGLMRPDTSRDITVLAALRIAPRTGRDVG